MDTIRHNFIWRKTAQTFEPVRRNTMTTNPLLKTMKIGFIGAGNMTQVLVKGLTESQLIKPDHIFVSNRTPGKLLKMSDLYKVQTKHHNEEVVENCDIVILATKPQDLQEALEPVANSFQDHQIIISLAAGIPTATLEKLIPHGRIVRLMPNTPSIISRGIIGYYFQNKENTDIISDYVNELFSHLGMVIKVESEEQLETLMISCSSGTGFVFEMMLYWQEWIQEHGFPEEVAKKMTIETFLGASLLAAQSNDISIEELQARVASKKGVTSAGLNSMRELEIERALRISFEKAGLRSQEISKTFK